MIDFSRVIEQVSASLEKGDVDLSEEEVQELAKTLAYQITSSERPIDLYVFVEVMAQAVCGAFARKVVDEFTRTIKDMKEGEGTV